jgi:predicted RNA-binding protein YlqC (UPF0109 family)
LGRKVHPVGFRIGTIRDWQGKWYSDKNYTEFLQEDLKVRNAVLTKYAEAAISKVEIDRQANEVAITIHTARPGIVIGRGGQRVDEMRQFLEKLIGKKVRLNIQEIRQPELDATLVSRFNWRATGTAYRLPSSYEAGDVPHDAGRRQRHQNFMFRKVSRCRNRTAAANAPGPGTPPYYSC